MELERCMKYNIYKKNKSAYLKELVFSQIKMPLLIGCVAIPFSIYFLTIGYVIDKEALLFGYPLTFIVLFMFTVHLNYFQMYPFISLIFSDCVLCCV